MFGTLRPHACALGHDARMAHSRFYCGLCKSLGDGYGTPSRILVGHDAVFVALVADGLLDEGAAPDRCRCPLLPVVHRPTVRPDSVAMRYAAAIQVMLADQWLADRAIEGKALAQIARPLASRHVAAAQAVLAQLGVSIDALEGFESRQAQCEVAGETGPDAAARTTAEALGHVFGCVADLPGAGGTLRAGATRRDLEALGRALGGVIYWTDALEDLRKDTLAGDFNPCVARDRTSGQLVISRARVEACVALLERALAALAHLSSRLPWQRHRPLVDSVLCDRLPRAARRAAAAARVAAAEEAAARLAATSWLARGLQRALVVLVVVWSWLLGGRAALAQDDRRRAPSLPPGAAGALDAGDDAGDGGSGAGADAGTPADGAALPWDWPDAPAPSAGATPPATPGEQPPGTTGTPGTDTPGPPTPGPGAPAPGGAGLPGCSSLSAKSCCCCDPCGKPCDACCKGGCDSCCKGGCDGCCKGCNCGGCCK